MVAIPANRDAVRLRGLEDDVTNETKARRKSTADKLRTIMGALAALIDEMEPSMDEPGEMYEDGMKPKPKGLELDGEVVAALATFAKEATNG